MTNNSVEVAVLSNTQRVTLKKNKTSTTIQKEWRKSDNQAWMVGKGIELPNEYIPALIESLEV